MKNKKGMSFGKQGFTMVEFLVYIGLLGGFLVILTDLFVSVLQIKADSEATNALTQDARYLLARLSYDVARSSTFLVNGTSLELVIGGVTYTYQNSSKNLVLTNNLGSYNLNSNGTEVSNLVWTQTGKTVEVNLTMTSTTQRIGGVETQTLSTVLGRR